MLEDEEHNSYTDKSVKRKAFDFDVQMKVLYALRAGQDPDAIMQHYNIDRSTFYEIQADKKKIEGCLNRLSGGGGGEDSSQSKRLKVTSSLDDKVEVATYKWYLQMKGKGVQVQGADIQKAAETIADHLGKGDFKASTGWLHKFRDEHDLESNKPPQVVAAEQSYTVGETDCLLGKVQTLMTEENLSEHQLYNADETGLFWKSMPNNTLEMKMLPAWELNKQRITSLLCANADGSHRFKSLIVGNLKNRRVLRNISSENLPVTYKSSTSALMTCSVFSEWFHNYFVPGVRNYQVNVLNVDPGDVKAVLLLDNAPCHPESNYLRSRDGRIKVISMPSTSSSKYQPLEQGIISSCKKFYRKYQLDDCLVYSKANREQSCEVEASSNIRSYSIKDAIYNWARAWKEIPQEALKNAWCKLLQKSCGAEEEEEEEEDPFEDDLQTSDYLHLLHASGDADSTMQDVEEWLQQDELELGYDEKAVMGIAPVVSWGPGGQNAPCEDSMMDDEPMIDRSSSRVSLNDAKTAMDSVIRVIDNPSFPRMHKYYGVAKEIRSSITDSILNRSGEGSSNFNLSRDESMSFRPHSSSAGLNDGEDADVVEVTSSGRQSHHCSSTAADCIKEEEDLEQSDMESRMLSILTRIETKVDVLNYKVDNLERRLDALSSHVAMPVDDDSYSWEELPVRTHEEFELLQAKLKQDNYYKLALERRLMLIGGDSLRSCVKRILEVLLSHEVQLLFNWAGTVGRKSKELKPKLAFKNTELCPILTRVVVRTNEGTTEDLIHKEVMLYLRGCADRCGGRQRRLQLKMRDDPPLHGESSEENNSQQQGGGGPSRPPHPDNNNSSGNSGGGGGGANAGGGGGPSQAPPPPPPPSFRPESGPPMPPHAFFGSEGFGNHHLLNLSGAPLSSSMQIDHSQGGGDRKVVF
uniref:Tigger transposable element-derived protein 7 n=2 Tax=Hirondellea gigas TaxID=1518452 RepID=A0A6A7FQA5_9CRUS